LKTQGENIKLKRPPESYASNKLNENIYILVLSLTRIFTPCFRILALIGLLQLYW